MTPWQGRPQSLLLDMGRMEAAGGVLGEEVALLKRPTLLYFGYRSHQEWCPPGCRHSGTWHNSGSGPKGPHSGEGQAFPTCTGEMKWIGCSTQHAGGRKRGLARDRSSAVNKEGLRFQIGELCPRSLQGSVSEPSWPPWGLVSDWLSLQGSLGKADQ